MKITLKKIQNISNKDVKVNGVEFKAGEMKLVASNRVHHFLSQPDLFIEQGAARNENSKLPLVEKEQAKDSESESTVKSKSKKSKSEKEEPSDEMASEDSKQGE